MALVSGSVVVGLLSAVCCLLFARCRQLYASCIPAAVGRKIKYHFPAWQAPEVFSERQPLIFSHYLCLCGSFFSSRICGIVFLPSAIRKVPGETAFLHHLLIPFPQRQHFPRFGAVAACSFPPAPLLQVFCAALPFRPVSTTAAFPAIRCRCGTTLWKVPTEAAFLHHLLEFVISRPAPEASLAGYAREPHPEGAGRNGLSPPPSRIRYKPTCPRNVPRRPCPGTPSGRCRRKCRLPGTFSFWYVASPHSFGRGCQVPAFSDSFGRSHRAFSGSVSLVGIVKPFSL